MKEVTSFWHVWTTSNILFISEHCYKTVSDHTSHSKIENTREADVIFSLTHSFTMWNTYYCQTIMDYYELWQRKRHRQAMHEVHCAETLHDWKQWCFSHRRSRTLNTAALLHTLTTPCWVFLGPWRERLASCAAHRPSFWPQAACVKLQLVRIRAKNTETKQQI